MTVIGVALLLLSACAMPVRGPSAERMQAIKTIQVVVDVPESNFSYMQNGQTVYVQPTAGVAVGTGMAINVAANVIFAGVEYAVTATAREAQGPVSKTVDDIDLRGTLIAQLEAMHGDASGAPQLVPSSAAYPRPERGFDAMPVLVQFAKDSPADATLFLSVQPTFRNSEALPAVHGNALLIDRAGEQLYKVTTYFVGPVAPDAQRAEVVRWWADGRYRRMMLHGARAALLPVADALWKPPISDDAAARIEERVSRLPGLTAEASRMRSEGCAFDAADAKVLYRFERQRTHLRITAVCAGGPRAALPEGSSPEMSWLTAQQPPLPEPVAKAPVQAAR